MSDQPPFWAGLGGQMLLFRVNTVFRTPHDRNSHNDVMLGRFAVACQL